MPTAASALRHLSITASALLTSRALRSVCPQPNCACAYVCCREWQPRAKHGLEALYNRPAASASDDALSPLRCTAPDTSSSVAVLEAMQSWVSSIIVQAAQYEVSLCMHDASVLQLVVCSCCSCTVVQLRSVH